MLSVTGTYFINLDIHCISDHHHIYQNYIPDKIIRAVLILEGLHTVCYQHGHDHHISHDDYRAIAL